MQINMRFFFILQLSTLSVAPVYGSQGSLLATTKASNESATNELFEVLQKEETTSDDIIGLINNGADVNAKNEFGSSPLIRAAMNGHGGLCITLIDKGADVNASDTYGWTPLYRAAEQGLEDVCITLINKRADINAKDNFGNTPLIGAASNGHANVCLTLISKGADVHDSDNYGRAALNLAAINGHTVVCILLLRHILLQQLLTADPGEEDLFTRKMRMRWAILTIRRTTIHKNLIPLIVKSKPLMYDYTACRYDTYCCRPHLSEHHHALDRDQLCYLLGIDNINELKATMKDAYDDCYDTRPVLKNLLNPMNFNQHFDELFLNPLKPVIGV